MQRTIFLFSLSLYLSTVGYSQKITVSATPEAAGFSGERLKRIDANMKSWVDNGWMNGAAALIIRNGKVVYYKSTGFNDLDSKVPLAKDGIFRIASQTKAITSVAVMILYEEGKFLWTTQSRNTFRHLKRALSSKSLTRRIRPILPGLRQET